MLFGLASLRGMPDKRHVGCLHTRVVLVSNVYMQRFIPRAEDHR
jgi:hypothetical protein